MSNGSTMEQALTCLQYEIFTVAKSKGWWTDPTTGEAHTERVIPEKLALIAGEAVGEAMEEYRDPGRTIHETYYEGEKPCGFSSELADVVIRCFDLAGYFKIDLGAAILEKMKYNATRPMRHGGKRA